MATDAIDEWLKDNDMDVSIVVFDKEAFEISRELHGEVSAFIDENYIANEGMPYDGREEGRFSRLFTHTDEKSPGAYDEVIHYLHWEKSTHPDEAERREMALPAPQLAASRIARSEAAIDQFRGQLDVPFSQILLRYIDASGKTDVEVYKRANIDRRLFSKIRSGKGYMPSKKTLLALVIALELSMSDTRDLLERAGFALSRSLLFDVIIEFFISQKRYDIFEINNVLFSYDQPLLGG